MKKILIALVIVVGSINVYAAEDTSSSNNDIFNSTKTYASSINTQSKLEIVSEGISLDKYIENKVQEKIVYKSKPSNTTNTNTNTSTTPNKKPVTNSTPNYSGTTNFTDTNTGSTDASVHAWSCINPKFDIYDDKGTDNVTILASAYTSSAKENGGYAGLNAINGKLGAGQVAAPKDIKFHTKIRISGLGVFDVTDRGGAIVRIDSSTIRLDVWHASYSEAMKFGRRTYKGRIMPI